MWQLKCISKSDVLLASWWRINMRVFVFPVNVRDTSLFVLHITVRSVQVTQSKLALESAIMERLFIATISLVYILIVKTHQNPVLLRTAQVSLLLWAIYFQHSKSFTWYYQFHFKLWYYQFHFKLCLKVIEYTFSIGHIRF